ncbi:MAG: maltose/maltodextrin transport system substrate-binding protein [bacterium]|nr:MAG: maltose/maltodextrin transport system substrate-binding protein [bacterium]
MGADAGRSRIYPWLLVGPAILVMAMVVFYPFVYNVGIAFSDMSLRTFRHPGFAGFRHFIEIFTTPPLYTILGKTVIWTLVNVTFHVAIGLSLALLLNGPIRGRNIYRALLILPWAMPQYIVALTWKGMFNYQYGAVNLILGRLGIPPVSWLSDAGAAFASAIIANIWLGFPFMMVICLGGLQSIPKEMYEAADIDGAPAWTKFRTITLPLLKPVLVPAIVLGIVWTFNSLNVLWLITEGGRPANQSHILVTWIYNEAFTLYRYGYAAAFSIIVFLILLGFSILFVRQTRGTEAAY